MSETDEELERAVEEFCASIKVDKNYPFSLSDRYLDNQGREITVKRIFTAGVEWERKRQNLFVAGRRGRWVGSYLPEILDTASNPTPANYIPTTPSEPGQKGLTWQQIKEQQEFDSRYSTPTPASKEEDWDMRPLKYPFKYPFKETDDK